MDDLLFGSDDLLFAEMLALLEDDRQYHHDEPTQQAAVPNSCSVSVAHSMEPTKKKSTHGIGSAARRKIAIDALRAEQQHLSGQLDILRGGTSYDMMPFQSARERAMAERLKRRRAEQECNTLRRAVRQQMQFVRGLRGAVADGPTTSLGLNLSHYLHNFTRLPRDRTTRQSEYMALSRVERLDAAIEMLLDETGHISVVDAHIDTNFRRESNDVCAASTLSVFTMDDSDVATVLRAACVAVRDILRHSRPFESIRLHGELIDADALHHNNINNIQYRATSVYKRSDNRNADADVFSVESLEVTMYKLVDDVAVMLWDFVDEDELVPLGETPDISRQSVGACLIRQETCPDGVARVVYRELSMRRYLYRGDAPTQPRSVQRYFASKQSSVGPNELVFRDIMTQQITQEAETLSRLRRVSECEGGDAAVEFMLH